MSNSYYRMWHELKAHVALAHVLNGRTHISIEELVKLMGTLETRKGGQST